MSNKSKNKVDGRKTSWERKSEGEKLAFSLKMQKIVQKRFDEDPEYKEMMRKAKQTKKFRRQCSARMHELNKDPVHKKKMREKVYDNPVVSDKISIKRKAYWDSLPEEELVEISARQSVVQTERALYDENYRKIMFDRNWNNDEACAKRVRKFKEFWDAQSSKEIAEFVSKIMKSSGKHPNETEKKLIVILEENGFKYAYTGDGRIFLGSRNPDFIHKTKRLIIEYDGQFWHNTPRGKKRDSKRYRTYKKLGYKLLVLRDLKDQNKVGAKIKRFEDKYKSLATRRPRLGG